MIKNILAGCVSLMVYFCIATIITQVILFSYVAATWQLNGTKAVRMLAIARGIDLFEMQKEADQERDEPSAEQVSYDEILRARALNVHHLQLREQALKDGLDQLQFEQRKLLEEKSRFEQVVTAFQQKLDSVESGAIASGMDTVRAPLETIKPAQAKQLLVEMLDNGEMDVVVSLLSAMPNSKCAKIMGEFKTPEETEQLSEILRLMRQGVPIAKLVQETEDQLVQPNQEQL